MSVGLSLLAKLDVPTENPERLLEETATWVHEHCRDLVPRARHGFVDTYPTLFCLLHPAAEEVELSLIDLEHLQASANTSTVGPGYHIFLCATLQAWARDFHARWLEPDDDSEEYSDEAEYFFVGDQQRVFNSMTSWLRALTGTFFDGTFDPSESPIPLCMPMGVLFESDQPAITPLGPRDRDWLRRTAEDGFAGRNFFAWWSPGLNAEYFLGRALIQMWRNVRWRRPSNDSERNVLNYVADSLEMAYKLDSSLEYPWTEWAEVLEFLGDKVAEAEWVRSHAAAKGKIGYRRAMITEVLSGGWSLRLPGSFSEFDSDEDNTMFAFDPPKEIWFTAYKLSGETSGGISSSTRTEILDSNPEFFREEKDFISKADIAEKKSEDGTRYYLLSSLSVCPNKKATCTLVFTNPQDRQWAITTWRSLRPPGNE